MPLLSVFSKHPRLVWLAQLGYTSAQLFNRNGLSNHAAATAFYCLLSATPVLLLLSYALQWLGNLAENSHAAAILMAALYQQLRLDTLIDLGFIPREARIGAGGVGLLTLALASRGLVNTVQGAFRVIFPEGKKRRLVLSWLLPLVILPLLFVLAGLAALAQGTLRFLADYDFIGLGNALLLQGLGQALGGAMLWSVLFLAFWRLPRQHPAPRLAAAFALLAALSLVGLLAGFSAFFRVEKYQGLYGALGGVVFVLIGAYLAALVFYFWAQTLYAWSKVDVAALEKLFVHLGDNRVEGAVFGDAGRLLAKYGQTWPAGHVLVREGATDRTAYFLYQGRAAVTRQVGDAPVKLGELAAGQLFGEMAYLLKEPRTASVTAQTELTVLALPPAVLEELMRYSAPLSRRIIDTLCQRLERMNLAARST